MSQPMVGIVIERLLAEEDIRIQLARDRIEALADLSVRGMELTPAEIEVFIQTDARLWFWDVEVLGDRVH